MKLCQVRDTKRSHLLPNKLFVTEMRRRNYLFNSAIVRECYFIKMADNRGENSRTMRGKGRVGHERSGVTRTYQNSI